MKPASNDHVDRVIAQWARERPDLDLAPVEVIARLGRAARYVDHGLESEFATRGLSRASWDVLASLRRVGPPYRLSPTELYRALMRTSGAITHRLFRLERAGLIRRMPEPRDGRSMLVELTTEGRRLVDEVAPLHLENERRLLASLTEREATELARLLKKLLLAFEAEHPIPPPIRTGRRRRSKRARDRRR